MTRNEAVQVERECRPQWGHATWNAIAGSVLVLSCLTLSVLPEAVAQENKGKPRKSAAKSKEAAAKSNEKETVDDEPKFTAEQIEKAKSKFTSAEEAFGVGAAHFNSKNYAASREPFEAALILAPEKDIEYRLKGQVTAPLGQ